MSTLQRALRQLRGYVDCLCPVPVKTETVCENCKAIAVISSALAEREWALTEIKRWSGIAAGLAKDLHAVQAEMEKP